MHNNYEYPIGADNELAPWNQKDHEEKEINVMVSITLSSPFKLKVRDYFINEDDSIDFSTCDLNKAMKEQHKIDTIKLKDWCIDDFEVILNE